uniref:NADH-ubiquinone oxidoreductase chain 2 n=1 Tax=Ophiothrix sp. TaxID=2909811 RepID=A0AAU6QCL2_9ECHI
MLITIFLNSFLLLSVTAVFFCTNWVLIWILVECITLCLLLLIRSNSGSSRNLEALSKYFIVQAVASFMLIFGIVLRYYFDNSIIIEGVYNYFSYFLIISGLLIKLGTFPNPYWFVDVVNGIGYSELVYILVVSKVSPLYILFNLVNNEIFFLTGAVGVLTALLASILGVNQSNFRKIISFSSVASLGWFILCLPLMNKWIILFCFLSYSLAVIPAIWVANYYNFTSLNKASRMLFSSSEKGILILCLLSLGGLPPFIGFFVKWAFFQSLINNSLYFFSLLLVLSSLFSLFFYLYCSFNLYSLFSVKNKGHNLVLTASSYKAVVFFVSLSVVSFVLIFSFVGAIW